MTMVWIGPSCQSESDLVLSNFINFFKRSSSELFSSLISNSIIFLSPVITCSRDILLNSASVLTLIYFSCFCSMVVRIFLNGIFLPETCVSSFNSLRSLILLFHIFVVLLSSKYGKHLPLFSPLAVFLPLQWLPPLENWYLVSSPHSNYIKKRGLYNEIKFICQEHL